MTVGHDPGRARSRLLLSARQSRIPDTTPEDVMLRSRSSFLAASLLCLASLAARAATVDVKPLEIGAPAPNFRLRGVDDKTYTLADFASAKILVVLFTCNHCPTAQAYEARVNKMY